MRDCIKRIVEKSNGAISKAEAKELLETLDREAKRLSQKGFDYDDSVAQIAAKHMQYAAKNIEKQKANMLRNIAIKKSTEDKLRAFLDAGIKFTDSFRADLEGIESPVKGARDSLQSMKQSVTSTYLSQLVGHLNSKDLMGILNSKKFSGEIGAELWALSAGTSVTSNKQIKEIASTIHSVREGQRARLNAAGADISKTEGGLLPQHHEVNKMLKMGEKAWVSFIRPLLDTERSFNGDYDNLDKALSGAYQAIVTSVRLDNPLADNAKLFQFSGPANLAKQLSQSRQLHFKDYASWEKWNKEFGAYDFNEGVMKEIAQAAEDIALIERYGTNPEAMMKETLSSMKKKYRGKLSEKDSRNVDAKIQSFIDFALEKHMIPGNPSLAKYGSNMRMYNNITMLGGAVVSSITDIPMKALEYKFQGKNWLEASVQPFLDLGRSFTSKEERYKWNSLTGVFAESMIGDIGGRFSTNDSLTSKGAKVQRLYFKLNGLATWTDGHKDAMSRVMSHDLGLERKTSFDKLDADKKRLFENYNITKEDWDIARSQATNMEDGRWYVMPELIDNAKVAEKFRQYYIDRVNSGVITPGVREQRIATFGTQRGTPAGELIRSVMQFKSFPITAVTKVWGRALYGKGKADIPAMVYLMLMTTVFGYLAGAAKDAIKGKTPKDISKPETFFAALAQGGGLGILSDLLFTETGFGKGVTQVLSGPTFGKLDELHKIYSAAVRGEGKESQLAKTAIGLVPGNNIFYARAALDQTMLYQMMEDLNPGYLDRMERNMRDTYGQELLFK